MASLLRRLLGGNTTLGLSRSLLFNCKNQAGHDDWFHAAKGMVGTDFRARHSILMVHVWLIHRRLLQCGKSASAGAPSSSSSSSSGSGKSLSIQESLFDELWDDTSVRIRAAGINELSVNKYLTQVQGYSFKTCVELDEALSKKSGDEKREEIAGTLWRSVYNKRDEIDEARVLTLADYVYGEHASLLELPDAAVLEGRVAFSPVPVFPMVDSTATKTARPLASSIDELINKPGDEDWREARAANGRRYWFNVKTRETRWEEPNAAA